MGDSLHLFHSALRGRKGKSAMNRKRLWNLRLYLSLLMSVSLGLAAVTWFISPVVFCVALPVTAVVCGLCIWQLVHMQRQIHNLFDKVMDQLDAGQRHYLHDFPLPVVIVTGEREVVWYSDPSGEGDLRRRPLRDKPGSDYEGKAAGSLRGRGTGGSAAGIGGTGSTASAGRKTAKHSLPFILWTSPSCRGKLPFIRRPGLR